MLRHYEARTNTNETIWFGTVGKYGFNLTLGALE